MQTKTNEKTNKQTTKQKGLPDLTMDAMPLHHHDQ